MAAWGWGVSDGKEESQVCTSTCQAGIAGSGEGQIDTPVSVAVDNTKGPNAHDVYVAERGNKRIERFDSSGAYLSQFGGGIIGDLYGGNSVATEPGTGNVWVTKATRSPAGIFLKSINNNGVHQAALGMALDWLGNIYEANFGGGTIEKVTQSGSHLYNLPPTQPHRSVAVAVDSSDNVFIGDNGEPAYRILKYNSVGELIQSFGSGSIGYSTRWPGRLFRPRRVSFG